MHTHPQIHNHNRPYRFIDRYGCGSKALIPTTDDFYTLLDSISSPFDTLILTHGYILAHKVRTLHCVAVTFLQPFLISLGSLCEGLLFQIAPRRSLLYQNRRFRTATTGFKQRCPCDLLLKGMSSASWHLDRSFGHVRRGQLARKAEIDIRSHTAVSCSQGGFNCGKICLFFPNSFVRHR